MQLALTALGTPQHSFIDELLHAANDSKCTVKEIRSSQLSHVIAAYLLVEGSWNQIAKYESQIDLIQKRLDIKIHTLRPEATEKRPECLPYLLETISLDSDNIAYELVSFLHQRDIIIEEIHGSSYSSSYIQSSVFSTKLIILVPSQVILSTLREDFLDFCDSLNIDAVLEPVKR